MGILMVRAYMEPKYEIRPNDGPVTWPDDWQHLGDVWKGDYCVACIFVDEDGDIRVQAEGEAWHPKSFILGAPDQQVIFVPKGPIE